MVVGGICSSFNRYHILQSSSLLHNINSSTSLNYKQPLNGRQCFHVVPISIPLLSFVPVLAFHAQKSVALHLSPLSTQHVCRSGLSEAFYTYVSIAFHIFVVILHCKLISKIVPYITIPTVCRARGFALPSATPSCSLTPFFSSSPSLLFVPFFVTGIRFVSQAPHQLKFRSSRLCNIRDLFSVSFSSFCKINVISFLVFFSRNVYSRCSSLTSYVCPFLFVWPSLSRPFIPCFRCIFSFW